MAFFRTVWPTVVETPGFKQDVSGVLTEAERLELAVHLARQPNCGDLIPGGRGLRKVRWKARQRGKRGGARVIYLYWLSDETLFLLAAYAKADREDLSPEKKRELVAIAEAISAQRL